MTLFVYNDLICNVELSSFFLAFLTKNLTTSNIKKIGMYFVILYWLNQTKRE